jgi:predicted nucleic-acid-binding Zn-ribbon protein
MHLERKSSIEATDQLIKTRSTQAKNIMAYVCAACWFSTFLNAQSFASAVHIYLLD